MEAVTITQITPSELQVLIENSVRKILLIERNNSNQPEKDTWFDVNEICEYLPDKPAIQTVYGWVHTKQIPYHKGGKKLRFLKSDIDTWLKTGKRKTSIEIASQADDYLLARNIKSKS